MLLLEILALLHIQRQLHRRLVNDPTLAPDQLDGEHIASIPMCTERITLAESSIGAGYSLPTGKLGNLPSQRINPGFVGDFVGNQRGALAQVVVDHRFDQTMT